MRVINMEVKKPRPTIDIDSKKYWDSAKNKKLMIQSKDGICLGGSSTIINHNNTNGICEKITILPIDQIIPKSKDISIMLDIIIFPALSNK